MIIVMIIAFIFIIGGMLGLAFWKIKDTDPNKADSSVKAGIDSTQSFIPFKHLNDGIMDLGNHQYRMILECSSINYYLQTDTEKDIVEASFQSFINSLEFPISIYVQTRVIDNGKMMECLKRNSKETIKSFPNLKDYANVYYYEMEHLAERIQNDKEKKKYIVLSYNDAINLKELTDEEKYITAIEQLETRAQSLSNSLGNLKINATLLNTNGLVELFYSIFHKDEPSYSDAIENGEFFNLIVEGSDKLSTLSDDGRLDFLLRQFQERLDVEVNKDKNISNETKEKTLECLRKIAEMRTEIKKKY